MKTITEHTLDKSKWKDGPWKSEPDKKQWLDEETGLPCLIVRHDSSGHLCGYVGVSKGHPWFELPYGDVDASVHGGLTYSEHCAQNICHAVEDGEDDNVWWLGFDAAHCDDLSYFAADYGYMPSWGTYKNWNYMESQCRHLAKQAKEAAK